MTQQQQNKRIIRDYLQKHFSHEKLAVAFAWNQDGKMEGSDPCACLLGVATSVRAHTWGEHGCDAVHYLIAKADPEGFAAEQAFFRLGRYNERFANRTKTIWGWGHAVGADVRQRVMLTILRAEMKRREKLASKAEQPQLQSVSVLG